MPLYSYICDAGHGFERIVPLATFRAPQMCDCGAAAAKQVVAPRVISDCIEGRWGSDGRFHESKQSYEAALKAAGHVQLAPGEEIKPHVPTIADKQAQHKIRRETVKHAMEDVKNGRVPPPPPPPPASVAGAYNV